MPKVKMTYQSDKNTLYRKTAFLEDVLFTISVTQAHSLWWWGHP